MSIPLPVNFPLLRRSQALPIANYPWPGKCRPPAWALCGMDAASFQVLLWCREPFRAPRYTRRNDPVYTESCLEAFASFYSGTREEYLNFECNAAGAMLLQFGAGRGNRRFLVPEDDPGIPFPSAEPVREEDGWGVRVTAPLDFVRAVYGMGHSPDPGDLRGNFYKCDETPETLHFGSWAPISAPHPDFHRPEFFRAFWEA